MALKCAPSTLRPTNCYALTPPAKERDPVYISAEYKRWREIVISRAKGICQWPGCNRSERRMFADHIIEIKDRGAKFDPANGQCLCGSHHSLKTAAEKRKRMVRPTTTP